MATTVFNVEEWEAGLPTGKPAIPPYTEYRGLDIDSIYSRPKRQLTPQMGPGAVVRTDNWGRAYAKPGIRGSLEGPPFIGKVYDVSSDKHTDEKEGTTTKGRWQCILKIALKL